MAIQNKTTLKDISEKLGISTAAVSKALRDHHGISEQTKKLVLETAKALNYKKGVQPSDQSKKTIGINKALFIYYSSHFGPHFSEIYLSIDKAFKADNINVTDMKYESISADIEAIQEIKPDIIILVGRFPLNYADNLAKLNIPMFSIDQDHPFLNMDSIMANDYQGGFEAVKYLAEQGHLEIGFIGDKRLATSFRYRFNGFRDAMEYFGLPYKNEYMYDLKFRNAHDMINYTVLLEHLDCNKLPTAFFCANDAIAYVLANALKSKDIGIPEDISIIGFDNLESSMWQVPPLTTIHYPRSAIGITTLELVKWRFMNPDAPKNTVYVNTKLIERESVVPPKQ
jgi:LacI family transcriptional regulator